MRLTKLPVAITNSKEILKKIKQKYPKIYVFLVLSTRFGQAPIDASFEYLLDEADYFFDENEAVKAAWKLLDQIFDETENLKENRHDWSHSLIQQAEANISSLRRQYQELVQFIEINDEVEVCLRWDEIDYDINRSLGVDSDLVDVIRSNTTIGGIKICLGTIRDLLITRS